jgi:hypothetical protein
VEGYRPPKNWPDKGEIIVEVSIRMMMMMMLMGKTMMMIMMMMMMMNDRILPRA